jgi:prepilin-type N-terminal cleavage/methylation domain-containing protein
MKSGLQHIAMLRERGRAGFSLVEVMVAVLILGIALAALTQGVTTALSSSKESELQATAALLAAGQLETLRAEGQLTDGETQGDCGDSLPLYRWRQIIKAAGLEGLHDVTVVVENVQSSQEIYELRTLLFQAPDDSSAPAGSTQRKPKSNRKETR